MEQEVNMKTACIAIQSSERAGVAFLRGLQGFVNQQRHNHSKVEQHARNKANTKEISGKMVKVKDLRKDGSQIEFVDMGVDEMKDFRKYARKYGVTYSMEKNKKTDPPTYLIYFKAKDSTIINKAISEYVADKMEVKDKAKVPTLMEKLVAAISKSKQQPKKVKNKEQVR